MPVHQISPTLLINVQTLAADLRSVYTNLARLLDLFNRKQRPRTAFLTHESSELSSEDNIEDEVLILDRAALEVVPFHLTPRGPTIGQSEVLQSSHRAFAGLLDNLYYYLANTRQERQPQKLSSTRRLAKNPRTSITTFNGFAAITILHFLSGFEED